MSILLLARDLVCTSPGRFAQKDRNEHSAYMRLLLNAGLVLGAVYMGVSPAYADESLLALRERMKISVMNQGIQRGDPSVLSSLPAKGYKDGLTGFMREFRLYPNPNYSFTQCGEDVLWRNAQAKPGCIVSIRLASKNADGSFKDQAIRIEYGVAPGAKQFMSNNSAYAEHAIKGDGALQAQFQ